MVIMVKVNIYYIITYKQIKAQDQIKSEMQLVHLDFCLNKHIYHLGF